MMQLNMSFLQWQSYINMYWINIDSHNKVRGIVMLYDRDYLLGLTEEEREKYKEVTGIEFSTKRVSGFGTVNNKFLYPKAVRMCKSLFPNNYLDILLF